MTSKAEQPKTEQSNCHPAAPLAGSVCGDKAVEALLTNAYAEGRKDEREELLPLAAHLAWALDRIRTSLDCGDKWEAASECLARVIPEARE